MAYKRRLVGAALQGALALLWAWLWFKSNIIWAAMAFVAHVSIGLLLITLPSPTDGEPPSEGPQSDGRTPNERSKGE
jgi:hypothetical protein